QAVQRRPRPRRRRPGAQARRRAPGAGGRRRHRLPLRRRGIQRAVSRAPPRRGAAADRGAARRDRALPDGGPRRGPAEEGRRGQQAPRRRDERGDAVGHGVDRRRGAFRKRAHAAYEKALLTSVTELRASAAGSGALAERFGHERALGESLKKLLLLQESYPQLKADANFRKLADELVEVEDHLQYARRFYNG